MEAKKRKIIVGSSTPEKEEASSRLEDAGKVGDIGWGNRSGSPKRVKGSAFRGRDHSKWSKE